MKKFDISKTSFANLISYSSCNEDSSSEIKALSLTEKDTVVCVTASGGRVLNLLLKKPQKLIAIDLNAQQNHLFEFKLAGIRCLSYEEFLELLGLKRSENRIILYDKLKDLLSNEARSFWDNRKPLINAGIIYRGIFEQFLNLNATVLRLTRNKKTKKLFTFDNIEEQREFFDKEWNTFFWKGLTRFVFSEFVCRTVLKDPGFYQYLPEGFSLSKYLRSRVDHSLKNHLAKGNFFAALFFLGKYIDGEALPLHLQEDNFYLIKKNISDTKIEVVLEPLEKYLWSLPEGSVDKFSLSDVSAYIDEKSYAELLEAVYHAGSPGSIYCLRHFTIKRDNPLPISNKFSFDVDLEDQLGHDDRTFVYSFKVGRKD